MRTRRWMRKASLSAPLLAALTLAGCSGSDAAAYLGTAGNSASAAQVSDTVETPARTPASNPSKWRTMTPSRQCGHSQFERGACMIELILADLRANYRHAYGGGITSIKAISSTSYAIALPQEERTDIFTYEFEVRGNQVSIKSKKESVESY